MIQFCKHFSKPNISIYRHEAPVKRKDPPVTRASDRSLPGKEQLGRRQLGHSSRVLSAAPHPLLIFASKFLEAEFIFTGHRGTPHQVAQTSLGYRHGVVDVPGS